MTKKTLFVTGGAGFIGSSFVAQRIKAGDTIIVYDALTYAGHKENIDWIDNSGGRLHFIHGNICNGELALEAFKKHQIDAVINFAAESHVDNSISSPSEFIETNINGTYSLLEASRTYWNSLESDKKSDFRYVQISTDEVYGSLGETGFFSETTPFAPNSPYSASKAAGDHLARAWFETYGLPTIVTNCTNNYGARQFPEKLIPHMINCALAGADLPIYGDGKNIRDWIHVEDHARGVYLALSKGIAGETYCFGGDAEKNNIEVVDTLCKMLDEVKPRSDGKSYKEQKTFVDDRLGHDRRYAIDDSKAVSELGFTREYNFAKGIKDTINWYLNNSDWCEAVTKKEKVV